MIRKNGRKKGKGDNCMELGSGGCLVRWPFRKELGNGFQIFNFS